MVVRHDFLESLVKMKTNYINYVKQYAWGIAYVTTSLECFLMDSHGG
jgi:hypothetical protein